jgi:hypothetical protein
MAAGRHAERFEGEPGDVHPAFDGLLADGFEEERLAGPGPGRRAADDQVLPAADPFGVRSATWAGGGMEDRAWSQAPSAYASAARGPAARPGIGCDE